MLSILLTILCYCSSSELVEYFRKQMSQDPDVASAVAAIRSLLEFLKRDESKSTHYYCITIIFSWITQVHVMSCICSRFPYQINLLVIDAHLRYFCLCNYVHLCQLFSWQVACWIPDQLQVYRHRHRIEFSLSQQKNPRTLSWFLSITCSENWNCLTI